MSESYHTGVETWNSAKFCAVAPAPWKKPKKPTKRQRFLRAAQREASRLVNGDPYFGSADRLTLECLAWLAKNTKDFRWWFEGDRWCCTGFDKACRLAYATEEDSLFDMATTTCSLIYGERRLAGKLDGN